MFFVLFCFLFFVFFVRGSCGHCNHWIGQLCVQSSVCRLGGSIVILNSLVVFFPGFHALRGESFSWRVANVNVNKQCFHLTGSLNSRSDALSGLHRVFFQQFSPGGSCPPHYGAFSPGLAKLKDQARAWFFSALTLFSSKGLSVRLVQVRTGCLQSQAAILTAGASRMFAMVLLGTLS